MQVSCKIYRRALLFMDNSTTTDSEPIKISIHFTGGEEIKNMAAAKARLQGESLSSVASQLIIAWLNEDIFLPESTTNGSK